MNHEVTETEQAPQEETALTAPGVDDSTFTALDIYMADSGLILTNMTPEKMAEIPAFKDVMGDLGIPEHVPTQYLLDREVALMAWREQQAMNVATGEVTEGFIALAYLPREKRHVTTYMGAMVLCRTLRVVSPPIKVTMRLKGRTLTFE